MKHNFYRTDDPDCPREIKDGNGEVVLSMCRVCRQAEVDLTENCPGPPQPPQPQATLSSALDQCLADLTPEAYRSVQAVVMTVNSFIGPSPVMEIHARSDVRTTLVMIHELLLFLLRSDPTLEVVFAPLLDIVREIAGIKTRRMMAHPNDPHHASDPSQ